MTAARRGVFYGVGEITPVSRREVLIIACMRKSSLSSCVSCARRKQKRRRKERQKGRRKGSTWRVRTVCGFLVRIFKRRYSSGGNVSGLREREAVISEKLTASVPSSQTSPPDCFAMRDRRAGSSRDRSRGICMPGADRGILPHGRCG